MASRLGALLGLTFLSRPWRIAVYSLVGVAVGLAVGRPGQTQPNPW